MFDLNNKTILVVGGAGYLGTPLCDLIINSGGRLCIADIDLEKMENTFKQLKKKYGEAKILTSFLDMSDESSIVKTIEKCVDHFGSLHGLVNATFGTTIKNIEELTAKDFNSANSINLTGSFLLARSAAKKMTQGGSIVMFSSMYGIVSPNPSIYPEGLNSNPIEYGAGKAGLLQMTRYLASYYGKKNIRVNAVAPGPFPNIDKKANDNSIFLNNLKKSTMLGRLGEAPEVAGPTVFLLSNASSYITGHTLNIDGGWTAW
jgi:NAD(P)-dependent dehydrogenase (short-subunit alcohol dehydrogenase family)